MSRDDLTPPDYAGGSLAAVLPAVARSLGAVRYAGVPDLGLAPARRSVVVLVDGLGDEQLRQRAGHAPFLRRQLGESLTLDSGFPSTTATSMGSFGTGTPPGQHGMLGYEVLDPETDRVFNELSWDGGPQPRRWQPLPTVFEALGPEGVEVTRVGPGFFDGSGLTEAALRGGRFVAAQSLEQRVEAALRAVAAAPRALVYLYWGDIDKVGHVHGCDSRQWGDELESVDRVLADLARRVPADTSVHVTADHGMVDVPVSHRVDLAREPALLDGVRHVGGEPRAVQLYCSGGAEAAAAVRDRWQERLGDAAYLLLRSELVEAGWVGPVRPEVLPRIGDVVALMRGQHSVVDSTRMRSELLALRAMHGSVSSAERSIPLVTVPAERA